MNKERRVEVLTAVDLLDLKVLRAVAPQLVGKVAPKTQEEGEAMNDEMIKLSIEVAADLTSGLSESEVRDMLNVRLMNGSVGLMNSITMSVANSMGLTDSNSVIKNVNRLLQLATDDKVNDLPGFFAAQGMAGPCDCVRCELEDCPVRKEDYDASAPAPKQNGEVAGADIIGKINPEAPDKSEPTKTEDK